MAHRFRFSRFLLFGVPIWISSSVVCAQTKPVLYDLLTETSVFYRDSVPIHSMKKVVVVGRQKKVEANAASPLQIFNAKSLKEINALQVSDAVKFFSGVTVKDFGGIGGMKSVSVRSMGAHHTAVAYDGVTITDAQTGQIDIGRYSLDNVEMISLTIGDGNAIFQPARLFASSSLLSIRTKRPMFENQDSFHGKLGWKSATFGFLNPSLLLEKKLNATFDLAFSGEALRAKGDYPYRLYDADAAHAFSVEKRSNNAVNNLRLESTLFGRFKKGQELEVKAYFYNSDRGLPGAVILYNPYSSQHLWDRNAFMQGHYEQRLSAKWLIQNNAKYNWSFQRYLNPDYLGSSGREDLSYYQDESYLSTALLFEASENLSLAYSVDGAVNRMHSDLYDFAPTSRYTVLSSLAAKYSNPWMLATAGVLATQINERRKSEVVAKAFHRWSPALSLSVKPFSEQEFRLRFFYKESFRMPSFNDLYYSAVGNSRLKPENSKQVNLGLTYLNTLESGWPELMLTTDVYHNWISDKILAIPTKNIFIWSMVNLGKVDIQGVDATVSLTQSWAKAYRLTASLSRSYQRALDLTNPSAKEYKNQIAYAPRVFGSFRLALDMPWVNIAYSTMYSGHRYVTGQNLAVNDLPGYTDHSISAEKNVHFLEKSLRFKLEVLNLLNENYEIVRNFPMQGRAFRAGCTFEF